MATPNFQLAGSEDGKKKKKKKPAYPKSDYRSQAEQMTENPRSNAQLLARLERLEEEFQRKNEQLEQMTLEAKRNELVSLGYPREKAAKMNNLDVLEAYIDDWRQRHNEKNLDDDGGEDEVDEEGNPKKKKKKKGKGSDWYDVQKVRGNAAPAIRMPDGTLSYAQEVGDDPEFRLNDNPTALMQHIMDPLAVPRKFPRWNETCRPLVLPPHGEKRYNRCIG